MIKDTLIEIVSYVLPFDIPNFMLVCKEWFYVAENTAIWPSKHAKYSDLRNMFVIGKSLTNALTLEANGGKLSASDVDAVCLYVQLQFINKVAVSSRLLSYFSAIIDSWTMLNTSLLWVLQRFNESGDAGYESSTCLYAVCRCIWRHKLTDVTHIRSLSQEGIVCEALDSIVDTNNVFAIQWICADSKGYTKYYLRYNLINVPCITVTPVVEYLITRACLTNNDLVISHLIDMCIGDIVPLVLEKAVKYESTTILALSSVVLELR